MLTPTRVALSAALLGACLALPGCVIGSANETEIVGRQISGATLSAITPGTTTEDQVLDLLGAPSRTMQADEGGMIYVYEYQKTTSSAGYLLFVFGGKSQKTETQTGYVRLQHGVVQKVWFDGVEPTSPSGVTTENVPEKP